MPVAAGGSDINGTVSSSQLVDMLSQQLLLVVSQMQKGGNDGEGAVTLSGTSANGAAPAPFLPAATAHTSSLPITCLLRPLSGGDDDADAQRTLAQSLGEDVTAVYVTSPQPAEAATSVTAAASGAKTASDVGFIVGFDCPSSASFSAAIQRADTQQRLQQQPQLQQLTLVSDVIAQAAAAMRAGRRLCYVQAGAAFGGAASDDSAIGMPPLPFAVAASLEAPLALGLHPRHVMLCGLGEEAAAGLLQGLQLSS